MFRPDIYLVILKIALKMSFRCSKNKIVAKVPNYLTATVSWDTSVKNIYILVQQQNIFWYRYSILFNLSATTKRKSLCVKVEKNRNFSTQTLRIAKKKKKKKKEEISRGVRGHAPLENFESRD